LSDKNRKRLIAEKDNIFVISQDEVGSFAPGLAHRLTQMFDLDFYNKQE